MNNEDLVAIIQSQRDDSLGAEDGDLSSQRAKALNHYHGRPYGNEVEGKSQVVSRDLSEAVDWALPAIMRVFTQSGLVGEFEPVGPEDEQAAQQESDYTSQVIMKDNPGFIVLHDAFKDTLLLKNGYVKHFWDESEKITEECYSGLSMEQVAMMVRDLESEGAEVEITEQEEKLTEIMTPAGPIQTVLFDIDLKVKRKKGKVSVMALPTEELRISRRCRGSLQDSPFVEHVTKKTRSELLEMGMPRDFVDNLPAYNETDNDLQTNARDSVLDESDSTSGSADRSMDEIEFCEAYIRVDYDGDGIAELRKVVTTANKIPPGDDWNESIEAVPITAFVAKRVPHRHVGESLDDELADLQEIQTVLKRQMLDNIYLTNNQRWMANERVNMRDLLTSTPGGVIRVRGDMDIGGAVSPVVATPILNQILPAIDYYDKVKESRTGITKASTGMDPDVLKESTKGAFMENLNRASQKIEMITRLLAETGVKELFLQVHGLLVRHQDKARMIKMRGKWVNVNPQEWKERTDLNVKVGLGTGNEEERRQKLLLVSSMQDRLGAQGMVGPKQAYSLFEDIAKTLGFDMPEKYIMSPESPEFQQKMAERQNQPNPELLKVQAQGQIQLQAKQAELQVQSQNDQRDAAREDARFQQELMLKQAELQYQAQKDADERAYQERQAEADRAYKQWEKEFEVAAELEKERIRSTGAIQGAEVAAHQELMTNLMDNQMQLRGIVEQAKAAQGNEQMATLINGLQAVIGQLGKPKTIVRGPDGRAEGIA